MKKTIIYGLMLALVASVVLAATATINSPASGSITGAFNFNVTIGGTTPSAFDNCTIEVNSANTANSSYVSLGTVNNGTSAANATENSNLNGSLSTSQVQDAATYTIRATCYNSTNASNTIVSAEVSSITIDNTVPSTPTVTFPTASSTYTNDSLVWQVGVTGANTTACTLVFVGQSPSSQTSYGMTHSGNQCTQSFTAVPSGMYTWYVTATDGTNSSSSSNSLVEFQNGNRKKTLLLTPEQAKAYQEVSAGTGSSKNRNIAIALLVIVGAIALSKRK